MSKPEPNVNSDKGDQVDEETTGGGDTRGITRLIPRYCVLRAGTTKPEPLAAQTPEAMNEQVQRQVRQAAGHTAIVYVYELISAEKYVPHSVTLTAEEVLKGNPIPAVTPTPADEGGA